MRTLTDAANANNTAIYPFDPRGLGPRPSGLFRALADSTGGQPIVNTNSPGEALRQVVRHASAYYLLGYVSGQNPTDGRFHEIEVRLRQRDLEVQARRGYWAPSAADLTRARMAAGEAAPPDITAALGTLAQSSQGQRLFDLWVGAAQSDGEADITVAWSPRAEAGIDVPAEAMLTATASDGRKCYEGRIPDGHVSFAAPPGLLRLQIAALDANDAIVDRVSRQVEVPDYGAMPLGLSVPAVIRIRSPRDARALLGNAGAPPFAGREFTRSERVLVRFFVYDRDETVATPAVRLLSRGGTALVDLPVEHTPGAPTRRTRGYQVDLPFASIARGEYVIAIDVTGGAHHARALVPLRVVQ